MFSRTLYITSEFIPSQIGMFHIGFVKWMPWMVHQKLTTLTSKSFRKCRRKTKTKTWKLRSFFLIYKYTMRFKTLFFFFLFLILSPGISKWGCIYLGIWFEVWMSERSKRNKDLVQIMFVSQEIIRRQTQLFLNFKLAQEPTVKTNLK